MPIICDTKNGLNGAYQLYGYISDWKHPQCATISGKQKHVVHMYSKRHAKLIAMGMMFWPT